MADDSSRQQPPPISAAHAHATEDKPVQLEARTEDAETRAARQELKHTAISDAQTNQTSFTLPTQQHHPHDTDDEDMDPHSGMKTPDLQSAPAGERKVSSPKKKRAHDEVESSKDSDGHRISTGTESSEGGWVMVDDAVKDEKHRSEPQKKRARDETSPPADINKKSSAAKTSEITMIDSTSKNPKKEETSSSAFASSGFSKLSSSTSTASPFAAAGAKKSVFGAGASSSPSPFASLGSPSKIPAAQPSLAKPTLSFGNKDSAAPSPFAAMNGSTTSAFGGAGAFGGKSGFGGGSGFGGSSVFSSTLGGSKAGNFATPGAAPAIKSDRPAKPFGAPDSDAEDDSDHTSDSEADEAGGGGEKDDSASRDESIPAAGEDEKKTKFKKVVVDDGEAGEATVIQARARMYYLAKVPDADGKEQLTWRERGAGILKINVPAESVKIDHEGVANVASFNSSVLDNSTPENPKMVRLLMRQDSTLRVILNAAMLASMEFKLKEGLKTHSVLFTAIDGADAKLMQVQMKMSQQSADTFMKSVETLKKRMKGETS